MWAALGADHLLQRFCQTASAAEIEEVLEGIKKRCLELGVPLPELVVVDNCCHVRQTVTKVLPDAHVVLDVFHFIKRRVKFYFVVTHQIHCDSGADILASWRMGPRILS